MGTLNLGTFLQNRRNKHPLRVIHEYKGHTEIIKDSFLKHSTILHGKETDPYPYP